MEEQMKLLNINISYISRFTDGSQESTLLFFNFERFKIMVLKHIFM